jgi:hypothetical protein
MSGNNSRLRTLHRKIRQEVCRRDFTGAKEQKLQPKVFGTLENPRLRLRKLRLYNR